MLGSRWPPTSCAHRLRKPDRTCEPLTPSVARCPPEHGLHPMPGLRRARLAWDRRRVRTTDTWHARAPSFGLTRTSRPERAWSCLLFTCTGLAPHPVACRDPGPPRQRPGGRSRLSRSAALFERRAVRKMRLSDFCNRPIIHARAPHGRYDSRARSRPVASRRSRVELRLTANLQLRRGRDPLPGARGFGPRGDLGGSAARSWRGHDRWPLRAVPPGGGVVDRAPSSRPNL
jgi:hypothetical protein